jgi:hypothetical protein
MSGDYFAAALENDPEADQYPQVKQKTNCRDIVISRPTWSV